MGRRGGPDDFINLPGGGGRGPVRVPPRGGLPGGIGWAAVAAAAVALVVLFSLGTARVAADEACAVTRFGAVSGEAGPGLHLRIPFIDQYRCFRTASTFYEVLEDDGRGSGADFTDSTVDGVTRDGQPLTLTFNVRFRIPRENVGEIYANIARTMPLVNERVVKFHSRTIARQQVQKYTSAELYSGDLDAVGRSMQELLAPRFAESLILLEYFEIKRPRFQPSYEQAIEAKQIAREQIETRANEATAAEQEALRVSNLAQGDADAERIRAAGEAEAITLRGQAVRDNPEIISLNYIDALRTINWAILDGESVTPFLTIEPPGGGGAGAAPTAPTEPTTPAPAPAPAPDQRAPTPAPVPTPPPSS